MAKKPAIILAISVFLLLLLAGLGFLRYFYVRGFSNAITSLVETGTGGKYSLEVGDADIDYFNLSMTIENLLVKKTDPSDSTGILQVLVPGLLIDLGPVTTVFTSNQFKIDKLTINEPVATVGLQEEPEDDVSSDPDPVNIPHHIARFYPVIEAILDHFDITLFEIDRAALKLEKSHTTFQVRLLDLLVSDWNMRHLADESRFHLALGNQSLELQHAHFTFGSVLWDYHRRELDILDYQFVQKDSTNKDVLNITGSSLKLVEIDFQQLLSEARYHLQRLLIVEPRVVAHIHSLGNNPDNSTHPLSDILKKHFGTLGIRDGEILNARIEATIYRESDTISLHLPKLNLITNGFQVNEDSSTLMIDKLNLDIHQTTLDINHDLALSFKNMVYDQDYNVTIDSLQVFNKSTGKPLLSSPEFDLYNFSVFHFLYENDLKADSVFLRDAQLSLGKDVLDKPRSAPGDRGATPTVHLSRVHLQNIDAEIETGAGRSTVTQLNGLIDDIAIEGQLKYNFRYLRIPSLNISDYRGVAMSIQGLSLEPTRATFKQLQGAYQGLEIEASDFHTISQVPISHEFIPHHFKRLEIGELSLNGSMPSKGKETGARSGEKNQTIIEALRVGSFTTDIALNDSSQVLAALRDLSIEGASVSEDGWSYHRMMTDITTAQYETGSVTYQLSRSSINTGTTSLLRQVEIRNKENYRVQTGSIEFGPLHAQPDSLDFDYLTLRNISYTDLKHQNISTVDSVNLKDAVLSGSGPYSSAVAVYGPDINLITASDAGGGQPRKNENTPSPLGMFGHLTLFPGAISLNEQRLEFGKMALEATGDQIKVNMEAMSFKTASSSIHIGRIRSHQSDLLVDSVFLVPLPEYIQQIEVETDVMAAQVNRSHLHNVKWDVLREQGVLEVDSMTLTGIDISIKRDKTLPDPENVWKPYLLADFIPDLKKVNIPRVTGKNARAVYIEIGEQTSRQGHVSIEDISFTFNRQHPLDMPEQVSFGKGKIYNHGVISYNYHRLDSGRFSLEVNLSDMPFEPFNQMVDPLQAARFRSGHLHQFDYRITGDSLQAQGEGMITYDDLNVEIFKSHQPDEKNLGSELKTLLVNKLILKHSKYQAKAAFVQDRITSKGPINYWVKSGIHAASAAVIKGKSDKKGKKRSRKSKR